MNSAVAPLYTVPLATGLEDLLAGQIRAIVAIATRVGGSKSNSAVCPLYAVPLVDGLEEWLA